MIRWIIMFKRILIEIVNFIQSQFFIKIIYYYDDQHYLLQTNEEYTKYNINRSCILYIIVSIYEKKLSISGFFNINIVSLFKSLFITVRTLEDMTYTLWLVLLETRCVVSGLLLVFDIALRGMLSLGLNQTWPLFLRAPWEQYSG